MSDIAKNLEEQANLLFENVAGWDTRALQRIGKRIKSIEKMSMADLQGINNAVWVRQDFDAIMQELATVMEMSASEVEDIYSNMVDEQHEADRPLYDYRNKEFKPLKDDRHMKSMVRAFSKATAKTMVGLSRTKAKSIGFVDKNNKFVSFEKDYKKILDKAIMSITTGTGDFHSEMREVLKELGGSGLRFDYGGGVTRRLDSMVRQNLLFGAKQASVEYSEMIGEELGCDGIEIDWHSNPRPAHEFMQGKQFSLHGKKTIKGVTYEDAGKALKALSDYGCLHFKTPIILGVSRPRFDPGELERLNRENSKIIEIDGVKKTGYGWKQTMRRLETEARKARDQIEILKASGDKEGVKQLRSRLKAINEKYATIAKATGIKPQYEKMAIVKGKSMHVTANANAEQGFRAVETDKTDVVSIERGSKMIKGNRLTMTQNEIYLSSKATVKPKQQQTFDVNISAAKRVMGISDADNAPRIIIVDSSELGGKIASYNAVDNVLRVDSLLGVKEKITELQKSGACPNNEISTFVHEFFHWKDAQEYTRRFGPITSENYAKYRAWANQRGKSAIDKLQKEGYDISSISEYATDCMWLGNYDEAYTEYRLLLLLGGLK